MFIAPENKNVRYAVIQKDSSTFTRAGLLFCDSRATERHDGGITKEKRGNISAFENQLEYLPYRKRAREQSLTLKFIITR